MATPISFTPKMPKFDYSTAAILAAAKRRRYFSISAISWIVMLILTVAIVAPAVQQILTVRKELVAEQDKLDSKLSLLRGLESLDSTELARTNDILEAALPSEKPVLPVLYSIDRLAATAQVSVANFQVNPGLLGTSSAKLETQLAQASVISPQLATLPLKMTVGGDFTKLSVFFQSLDNVVPFIQINSIEFSTDALSPTATTSAGYSAEVSLSSLYLRSALNKGELTSVTSLTPKEQALVDRLNLANQQREQDSAIELPSVPATSSGIIFRPKE